jgi:hypothetical protein
VTIKYNYMTNVNKKRQGINVHLHIGEYAAIISEYLPTRYVQLVQQQLGSTGSKPVSDGFIRNEKNRILAGSIGNVDVLKAMFEVAKNNKITIDSLNTDLKKFTNK